MLNTPHYFYLYNTLDLVCWAEMDIEKKLQKRNC